MAMHVALFLLLFLPFLTSKTDAKKYHKQYRETNSTRKQVQLENLELARTQAQDKKENANVKAEWIKTHTFYQELDHFNRSSNSEFIQRYFQYDACFKRNGSELQNRSTGLMFVVVGGEWVIDQSELILADADGHITMHDAIYLACREGFQARVLLLEHRYYGESQVVDVQTADAHHEKLRFLRVEQAIEDLATFIRWKAAEFDISYSKIVLFGCSYGGTVASFFRLTHPELCAGVVSLSGPLQPTFNFASYYSAAKFSFDKTYPECYRKIDKVLRSGVIAKVVENSTRFSDVTNKTFADLLNVTNSYAVSDSDNITDLYQGIASSLYAILGDMQQGDIEQKINNSCAVMKNADVPSLAAWFGKYNQLTTNALADSDTSSDYTQLYFWTYQTCVQFGFFNFDTSVMRDWFPPLKNGRDVVSVEASVADSCTSNYSIEVTKVKSFVAATNQSFMAENLLRRLTNFLMINGELDPWSLVAKLPPRCCDNAAKPTVKTIVVPGAYHCPHLNIRKRTTQREAKQLIDELVEEISFWTSH